MSAPALRVAAILVLALLFTPSCGGGGEHKPWPVPGAASTPQLPRPPELEADAAEPLRVQLTNFGVVYLREPSRATVERWIDYVGWLVPRPATTVKVNYPEHTFLIEDGECGNGELVIDGVRWQGGAFALSPDGSVEAVTARTPLETLTTLPEGAATGPAGD